MKPAFLGDAALGDHVAFSLSGAEYTGIITGYIRENGVIHFTLSGNDHVFKCGSAFHIWIAV